MRRIRNWNGYLRRLDKMFAGDLTLMAGITALVLLAIVVILLQRIL